MKLILNLFENDTPYHAIELILVAGHFKIMGSYYYW